MNKGLDFIFSIHGSRHEIIQAIAYFISEISRTKSNTPFISITGSYSIGKTETCYYAINKNNETQRYSIIQIGSYSHNYTFYNLVDDFLNEIEKIYIREDEFISKEFISELIEIIYKADHLSDAKSLKDLAHRVLSILQKLSKNKQLWDNLRQSNDIDTIIERSNFFFNTAIKIQKLIDTSHNKPLNEIQDDLNKILYSMRDEFQFIKKYFKLQQTKRENKINLTNSEYPYLIKKLRELAEQKRVVIIFTVSIQKEEWFNKFGTFITMLNRDTRRIVFILKHRNVEHLELNKDIKESVLNIKGLYKNEAIQYLAKSQIQNSETNKIVQTIGTHPYLLQEFIALHKQYSHLGHECIIERCNQHLETVLKKTPITKIMDSDHLFINGLAYKDCNNKTCIPDILNNYRACDVFICYNRDDSHQVYPIVDELEKNGINCYIDRKISFGVDWRDKLKEYIIKSEQLVVFAGSLSEPTIYQKEEIALSTDKNKKICPVVLPGGNQDFFSVIGLARLNRICLSSIDASNISKIINFIQECEKD